MPAWQSSALTRRAFLKSSLALPLAAASRTSSARSTDLKAAPDLRSLPGYIHNVMHQLNVPGMAVSIVHQGRTLFCRGFGVKNLATGEPVDEHTLFSLASQTKPFTGTCFAILETEGRLQTQRPVLDYVPNFRLSSPEVTRQMRVSELLSHLSGLPAHAGDQLFFPPTDYSLSEVVERIHALPLVRPFGSTFAYENVLYAVAALLIQHFSGMTYEQFVSNKIFRPLGMHSTAPNANGIRPDSAAATGYGWRGGTRRAIPPLVWVNDPGAGGIYSSAFDMTHWMRLHLQGGVHGSALDAVRLYSRQAQQRMWTPRINIPLGDEASEADQIQYDHLAYGAGWFLSRYRGERLVWHTGQFPGFVSKMSLMPSRGFGIVVLTNQENDAAYRAVTNHVLDLVMGAHDIDWLRTSIREHDTGRRTDEKELAEVMATRTLEQDAPVDCSSYEGTYHDAWYGDARIWRSGGKCLMHFQHTAELIGEMHPWARDTFVVRWRNRLLNGDALVFFQRGSRGTVASARMKRLSHLEAPAWDFRDMHLVRVRT